MFNRIHSDIWHLFFDILQYNHVATNLYYRAVKSIIIDTTICYCKSSGVTLAFCLTSL